MSKRVVILSTGHKAIFNSTEREFCEHCYELEMFEPSIQIDDISWCVQCAQTEIDMTDKDLEMLQKISEELELEYIKIRLSQLEPDSIIISAYEYMTLQIRDAILTCLEFGGVDNWTWYCESLALMKEHYPEFVDEEGCILDANEVLEKED